jgi:hypothetical protein
MGDTVLTRGTATTAGGLRPPIEHRPSQPPLIGDYASRRETFTRDEARGWDQIAVFYTAPTLRMPMRRKGAELTHALGLRP